MSIDFNTLYKSKEYEFYDHSAESHLYCLVYPEGFYVGVTKKKFKDGFDNCISDYWGSGNALHAVKAIGSTAKRYILHAGSYADTYKLEQRVISKVITANGNLNLGLDTLAASDAVLVGLHLEEDAEERLHRIVKHFSDKEQDRVVFAEKLSKLRNDKQLRLELLQLRSHPNY